MARRRSSFTRKALTAQEIVNIKSWRDLGIKIKKIAKVTGRSPAAIYHVIKRVDGNTYIVPRGENRDLTGVTPETFPRRTRVVINGEAPATATTGTDRENLVRLVIDAVLEPSRKIDVLTALLK